MSSSCSLYDLSKSLCETLMDFIYQLVGRGDLVHAKCLREKCLEKIRQRDREFATVPKVTTYNIVTRTYSLLDFKSEHIAEQMTLLDSHLFHDITVSYTFLHTMRALVVKLLSCPS